MLGKRAPTIKKNKRFPSEETQISEQSSGFENRKTAQRERCFLYYKDAHSTKNLTSKGPGGTWLKRQNQIYDNCDVDLSNCGP